MDRIKLLYTTADGRLSRKDWWIGVIGLIITSLVLTSILALVGLGGPYGWGQLIAYVILFYPGWCIGIKRRQDRDNNGMDFKVMMGVSGLLTLVQALGIGVTMRSYVETELLEGALRVVEVEAPGLETPVTRLTRNEWFLLPDQQHALAFLAERVRNQEA